MGSLFKFCYFYWTPEIGRKIGIESNTVQVIWSMQGIWLHKTSNYNQSAKKPTGARFSLFIDINNPSALNC